MWGRTLIYIHRYISEKPFFIKKQKIKQKYIFYTSKEKHVKQKLFYGSVKNTNLSPSEFFNLFQLVNNLEFLTARPSSWNTIGTAENSLL